MEIPVQTVNGKKVETVYDKDDFPYEKIRFYHKVRKGQRTYYNVPCAFDIETTSIYCDNLMTCNLHKNGKCPKEKCPNWIAPYAYMYHWQFCIDKYVCFGRTWEDFLEFIDNLHNHLGLTDHVLLPVYVHNLAYEFQFLRGIFPLTEVFARKERQPIKARSNGIEWRCSYMLSNMSLAKFCENTEGIVHYKGDAYDYNKRRTPNTRLTEEELSYCYNDVRGLCECIESKLKDDTVATIPMTSTGYVRRECREAVQKVPANRKRFRENRLDLDTYKASKHAFRGGDTHANSLYTGEILDDLEGFDIASSYTSRMLMEKFPMRFVKANPHRFREWIKSGYAVLFRVMLKNVRQRFRFGTPYLSVSKMFHAKHYTEDNGRILDAEFVDMWITDVDWKIIESDYKWDNMQVVECYIAKYEYLDLELRKTILKYFEAKTCLKGDENKLYEYIKSKNKLNGIYGMTVTDIMADLIEYGNGWGKQALTREQQEDALNKYYSNRRSFLSYQHGVWVTAHARKELHRGLSICDCVYNDTDSCKTFKEYAKGFDKLNAEIWNEIDRCPLPPVVTHNGKSVAMGIWDHDASYEKFITWGAKKYAYIKKGDYVVHTTVAGLGVKEGSEALTVEGIEEFYPGKVFFPSGRLTAFYNDEERAHHIEVDGCRFLTASNLATVPGTYQLGITETYNDIIKEAQGVDILG